MRLPKVPHQVLLVLPPHVLRRGVGLAQRAHEDHAVVALGPVARELPQGGAGDAGELGDGWGAVRCVDRVLCGGCGCGCGCGGYG